MLDPAAIQRFRERQRSLLAATYLAAWQHGVRSYQPDPDPAVPLPADDGHPDVVAAVGLGPVAAILAKRQRNYVPPAGPDPVAQARAMAPALGSIDRMTGELANILPTPEQGEQAQAAAAAGSIEAEDAINYAMALTAQQWLEANTWRLNGNDSVPWAAEQNGYAEAADADGALLTWTAEGDGRTCDDCLDLESLPPMPLADWPTTPGSDATICDGGCRCSLTASDDQLQPGDSLPDLTDAQNAIIDRIATTGAPPVPAGLA